MKEPDEKNAYGGMGNILMCRSHKPITTPVMISNEIALDTLDGWPMIGPYWPIKKRHGTDVATHTQPT